MLTQAIGSVSVADAQNAIDPSGEEAVVAAFLSGEGHNPIPEGAFQPTSNMGLDPADIPAAEKKEVGSESVAVAAATKS
jgi:hypothetical protein